HLPKHSVLAIQMRGGQVRDEKLATVGVRPRVRHGENSRLVVAERPVDFIGELVSWTTPACAGRVAPLDHEVRDHTMERNAVVVAALGEIEEICGGDGHPGGEDGSFDVALVCV